MKIVITSTGKSLNSKASSVFGRSSDFIIINLAGNEIEEISAIENPVKYEKGAGNLAAQFMVDHDIKIVISGEMGPVAFHILRNAGIQVYKVASITIEKNLKRFREDKLKEIVSLSSGFPK